MKKLFLFISLFIPWVCFGQSVSQRSNGTSTVNDPRWMSTINLVIPRYADTTAANVQKGIDSCGAIIFTYADSGKVYVRKCFPVKYWAAIGSGGGGSGTVTGGINGTQLIGSNIGLGGSNLIQYSAIGLNGFPLTLNKNGITSASVSDSNGLRLTNNTLATSSSDANQQWSPPIILRGSGWKTLSVSGSKTVDMKIENVPINGGSNPFGQLKISSSINGGAYVVNSFLISSATALAGNGTGGGNNRGGTWFVGGVNNAKIWFAGTQNLAFGNDSTLGAILNTGGPSTSQFNTAIGGDALARLTISNENTAVGYRALRSTDADYNTAVGSNALLTNTSGQANSAFGKNALAFATTAQKNTAIGAGAMEATTTGGFNTAVGEDAMLHNTTGTNNVAIGWLSGALNPIGIGNVSIGFNAGTIVASGDNNTFLGLASGNVAGQEDTVNHSIAIGANSFTTASNQMVLGSTNIHQTKIFGSQVGSGADSLYSRKSDGTLGAIAQSSIVGATPTLQQVLTAGSNVTAVTQSITGTGSNLFSFTNFDEFDILNMTGNSHFGGGGIFNFDADLNINDSLQINNLINSSLQTRLLGQNGTNKYVGYITIGSGLSLSLGVLSATGGSGITVGTTTVTSGTGGRVFYETSGNKVGEISGATSDGTTLTLIAPILGTPASGTLTNATGYLWNNIANPTGDQALTFDVGEGNIWTNSNTTEDLLAINTSTLTTASLFSLNSTSTALASGNNLAEFVMSGANGSSSITATAIRASVTNSGTTNTNIAIDATATGGSTDNWAVNATGNIKITTANTTQVTTSAGLNVNANSLTNGTAVYIVSSTLQAGTLAQIVSTSTALAANNEGLDIAISGANGTNAITATGIRSTVTNTNGTSGTNVAASFTASGATTANIALQTGGGNVLIGSPTNNTVDGVIIQSPTNTAGQGLRIYANNNSTYTELGYGAILNPGGFAIQSSSATVINLVGTTTYIGAATTATSTLGTLSFAPGYVAKTANYTATISDFTIEATANTFTVTLPTAVGITGRIYYIVNSGAGTITIATTSSQTFVNVTATPTTLTMATLGTTAVQSNGTGWMRLSSL